MCVDSKIFFNLCGWLWLSYSRIDLVQINKTVSIYHFHETEIDGKFIFQQL